MEFNKTENIKTHDQLKGLINHYKTFIETGEGQPPKFLEEFVYLVSGDFETGITVGNYTWVDQTKKEIEGNEKHDQDKLDLLAEYQSNPEKWRSEVIKIWSIPKLYEWIDLTYIQPLKYDLSPEQMVEREAKRIEILEYHNQTIYTDDPVKPKPPSYI